MEFRLNCDTCAFTDTVTDEGLAYVKARDHEREEGTHFVLIETLAEESGG